MRSVLKKVWHTVPGKQTHPGIISNIQNVTHAFCYWLEEQIEAAFRLQTFNSGIS